MLDCTEVHRHVLRSTAKMPCGVEDHAMMVKSTHSESYTTAVPGDKGVTEFIIGLRLVIGNRAILI